jgi:hypothetical protein
VDTSRPMEDLQCGGGVYALLPLWLSVERESGGNAQKPPHSK